MKNIKQPIKLRYPKSLFKMKEVLKEKKKMGTPKDWKFISDKKNYYLKYRRIL